ncbi:regulator of polyketide synthase expression [hydrocarbon metagenome]|uniref:Regulator of polyketide synthase expression n=1 Tax=hydrocarbon metagenome TaxID=938273 RepID=A0A0W8E566_9ZZZZ
MVPANDMISYHLLEETLGNGLKGVVAYLKHNIKHHFIISDDNGKVHYPAIPEGHPGLVDDHYIDIPKVTDDSKYLYREKEKKLYFLLGQESIDAYIIIYDIEKRGLPDVLPFINHTRLALKYYFANLKSIERVEKSLKNELLQDLLYNNNAHLREVLKNTDKQKLDINQIYYIGIIEPESDINIDTLYSYSKEWLQSRNYDPICSIWMNSLIVICPVHFKDDTLEIDSNWDRHYTNVRKHKNDMEKRFDIKCSIGIGQKYPLMELHRSYNEAKIALHVSRLMGERNFIKHFRDLGIFTLLYKHDPEVLKDYCFKMLGKIIDHDRIYESELMAALRLLFDTNMNWKETASSLFIHVNTLRYRMNKIEELLEVDLSTTQTQANLFMALKLYDSLVANAYINE